MQPPIAAATPTPPPPARLHPTEPWCCPVCGKVLAEVWLTPGSIVIRKCPRCKQARVLIAP